MGSNLQSPFAAREASSRTMLAEVEYQILTMCTRFIMDEGSPVADACRHHFGAGGSRVRAAIALETARRLNLDLRDGLALSACCELLHNASLVHDDLQDGDGTRRGRAAVWAAYGSNVAICVGDVMVSAAYGSLASVSLPEALPSLLTLTHRAVARTIGGQAADLDAGRTPTLTIANYEAIAADKSGPLLALPLMLPLTLAGYETLNNAAESAARHFAIGYQIVDDLEDSCRDGGSDERPASLNILGVLAPGAAPAEKERAIGIAAARARGHLECSLRLAADLPGGCGEALSACVRKLTARLGASA